MRKLYYLPIGFALIVSCQSESNIATQQPPAKSNSHTTTSISPVQNAPAALVDIPALLHLSSTEIKKKLGPPADDLQADVTDGTHALVYKLGDKELNVDYVVKTGQVLEISLGYRRNITDFTPLYALGKVSRQDTTYTIDSLGSEQAGKYRGIVVYPNPPVELTAD